MAQTLDQKRAALAWGYASAGIQAHGKSYKGLAKGASMLIMNSGLMPTLAFYNGKSKREPTPEACLLNDLMAGLVQRLNPTPTPRDFAGFMNFLQKMESCDYLRYTDEALELLKWLRQFVDAVPQPAEGGQR
ncbi:MAG: type III-B CRISPR module-associated protein Cmr5 [Leptothrix ochracea]|uniref:type III-B CRISPR module-associated protein Cmr5 n=1 Tax=Leptothrix ochracea TaxID=735331 RepID=UPI0034E226BE